MFEYYLGNWKLEFDKMYRIVKDEYSAVVIDDDRQAVVLMSLKGDNICIERTYYAMVYEIVSGENLIKFHTVE